jgi:serpin B
MPISRHQAVPMVAATLFAVLAPVGAVAQEAGRPDVQALTRAYNASGQALFKDFSAQPGNIVFSPYSIGTAMAMALAGARGDTEREMHAVLHHSLSVAQINNANAAAMAILNGYDKAQPSCPGQFKLADGHCEAPVRSDGGCPFPAKRVGNLCVASARMPPSAKLLVANALMLSAGTVMPAYETLVRDQYGAEVFRGATLDTVNGWVAKRTEGKIDKILDKPSDMVLVNAVYFKSRWALVFDQKLTKNEFFSLSRSRQEMVPTMLQRADHAVTVREGYRAIRLPYAIRSLAMVIALPNEIDGVDDVSRRIDQNELTQLLGALRKDVPRPVVLSLPRFKTEYRANLKPVFQKLGMSLPFDLKRADFGGMVKEGAAIDQIVHRAVIEVSEEATEAAAATGVGFIVRSAKIKPVEPLQFRVERPFLYYLVDETTGAVLFQGRIVDPR